MPALDSGTVGLSGSLTVTRIGFVNKLALGMSTTIVGCRSPHAKRPEQQQQDSREKVGQHIAKCKSQRKASQSQSCHQSRNVNAHRAQGRRDAEDHHCDFSSLPQKLQQTRVVRHAESGAADEIGRDSPPSQNAAMIATPMTTRSPSDRTAGHSCCQLIPLTL